MRERTWPATMSVIVVCLLIAASWAVQASAQESEETAREQAAALAAEAGPVLPAQPLPPATPFGGTAVTHPLFVGVDDTTVPAY